MPRSKAKPVRRESHRFEGCDAAQNDAHDGEEGFLDMYPSTQGSCDVLEIPKKTATRRRTDKVSCAMCEWTDDSCLQCVSNLKTTTGTKFYTLFATSVVDNTLIDIVSSESTVKIDDERSVLSDAQLLVCRTMIVLRSSMGICHMHIPPVISSALFSCKKSLYHHFSVSSNGYLYVKLCVDPSTSVPPILLTWQLDKLKAFRWYGDRKDFSLNCNGFLSSFCTEWRLKSNDELQSLANELENAGVQTSLRQYQLEGVSWMWKKLIDTSLERSLSNVGWICVNEEAQIYYNEVFRSYLLQNPTTIVDTSKALVTSCILADEMGIGKSLQVLSFLLLLRQRIEKGLYTDVNAVDHGIVEQRIIDFYAQRAIAADISSNPQRLRRRSAVLAEAGCMTPCFCDRSECEAGDIGWIHCSLCKRPRHLRCAGLTSLIPNYQCLTCVSTYHFHHPISSKTALIIIPGTLINQWLNEIKRHVHRSTSLRVCVYRGKKNPADLSKLTPAFLSSFDIIFISFKALKSCFHEADLNWNVSRNLQRRYDVCPPPLLGVEFSLVVIDETQNIEGATENMILKMAMKLRTRRKLSVSGTPFGIGTVRDLLHLAQFLEIPPLHEIESSSSTDNGSNAGSNKLVNAWANFLENPVMPISIETRVKWLTEMFEPYILRRTKDMVRDQLGIANRFTLLRNLYMSDFEKKLYLDSVKAIQDDLLARQQHFQEFGKAKIELIRKACSHPRIFDPSLQLGRITGASSSIDQVMIMKVEQSKIRCEEAQRDLLFYLFKLAGLRLLQATTLVQLHEPINQFLLSAICIYQLALSFINRNRLPTSSYGLFQLVGDETFDSSHTIVPCFSTLLLTWSPSDLLLYSLSDDVAPDQANIFSDDSVWRSSIILLNPEHVNDANRTNLLVSPSSICKDWLPSVRLGTVHKKTLVDINIATVSHWKIEKFCRCQLELLVTNDNRIKNYLVVLFPGEFSLSASDFHDSFATVVTKQCLSPKFQFMDPRSAPLEDAITSTVYEAKKTYRAKQWKIAITKCASMALVARFRDDCNGSENVQHPSHHLEFSWISIDDPLLSTAGCVNEGVAVHMHLWANFQLSETMFDTDTLQELHVQHNLWNAFSKAKIGDNGNEIPVTSLQWPMLTSTNQISQLPSAVLAQSSSSSTTQRISDPMEIILQQTKSRKTMIETEYLGSSIDRRNVAYIKWQEASQKVQEIEAQIMEYSHSRNWWSGVILEYLENHPGFWEDAADVLYRSGKAYENFRGVSSASTLLFHLKEEFDHLQSFRKSSLKVVSPLNRTPSEHEILEAANCQQCRAYFQRQGVVCTHCRHFSSTLQPYKQKYLSAARNRTNQVVSSSSAAAHAAGMSRGGRRSGTIEEQFQSEREENADVFTTREFEEGIIDGAYAMWMKLVKKHASRILSARMHQRQKDNGAVDEDGMISSDDEAQHEKQRKNVKKQNKTRGNIQENNTLLDSETDKFKSILKLMKLEVQWVDAIVHENHTMIALWDRYSELLKTYDEIEQCISRVQLLPPNVMKQEADVEAFSEHELPGEFQATQLEAMQAEAFLQETVSSLHFFRKQLEHYHQEMLLLESFEYHQQHPPSSPSEDNGEVKKNSDPEEICCICQDSMLITESRAFLPCAHRFHSDCVHSWLQQHRRCPYCREATSLSEVRILQAASSHQSSATATANAMATTGHRRSVFTVFNAHGEILSGESRHTVVPGEGQEFQRMLRRVKGRWGTKIDALLADILLIVHNPSRQDEKGIIFSQWTEMLEIVADALRMNNVRFTSCYNRQRDFEQQGVGIEAFRHNPELRFLLMPLHLGAEGLDLVVANHVFLLEPLLNHSQEAQAINRIDRLGQSKRATYVHKYVLCDSIEERIVSFQQRLLEEEQQQQQQQFEGDEEDDGHGAMTPVRSNVGMDDDEDDDDDLAAVCTPVKRPAATVTNTHTNHRSSTTSSSSARAAAVYSPSASRSSTGRKRKRVAAGDDDILDAQDMKFILSIPTV